MKIKIEQMNKNFKALGAYGIGSIKDGEGHIMIDFEGVESETSLTDIQKKEVLVDAIVHELHHAISDFFGLELKDPDGMCGGTENQVMVIVPLEEHEQIVKQKDDEIGRYRTVLSEIANKIQEKKDNVCGSWTGGTDACDDMVKLANSVLIGLENEKEAMQKM